MMKHLLIAGAAVCLSASVAQADVTVGVPTSGNCLPFGCASSNNLVTFQEIYAGSQFGAGMSIGSVSFFKDVATAASNATLETMSFNLSFYTSSKAVSGLSSDIASNRGTLLADFGTFSIGGAMPDVLTFSSTTAFNYDPSAGNLLLQLTVISDTTAGSGAFFQSDNRVGSSAVTRRAIATDFGFNFTASNGLVTGFSSVTLTPAAVPEPASWALFIGGFGLIGATMRRKKAIVSFG